MPVSDAFHRLGMHLPGRPHAELQSWCDSLTGLGSVMLSKDFGPWTDFSLCEPSISVVFYRNLLTAATNYDVNFFIFLRESNSGFTVYYSA